MIDQNNPVFKSRIENKMTQSELANEAKVSIATISKAENGHTIGELSENKIAGGLGKRVDDIFPLRSV